LVFVFGIPNGKIFQRFVNFFLGVSRNIGRFPSNLTFSAVISLLSIKTLENYLSEKEKAVK